MARETRPLLRQPLVAVLSSTVALLMVAGCAASAPSLLVREAGTVLPMTFFLVLAVLLAYRFPIHIRHNAKINVTSVPLYLLLVLLPVQIGPAAGGLAMLGGELMTQKQKGGRASDIATQVARWIIIGFPAAVMAHLPPIDPVHRPLVALGAALILWTGDIITSPLLLTPISGEKPRQIIRSLAHEAGPAEGAQYFVGLLGSVAAREQPWSLVLLALPMVVVYLAFKNAKEMHEGTRQMLETMADTVDLRDPYTGGHSRRVADYVGQILRELKMVGPEAELIFCSARVHDIGKIGIPDDILKKDGALTAAERAIIDTHPEQGADFLMRYPDFARGAAMVRHHHERWDGEGYPHRLHGTEIPFGARVIAVADSFDAMTSDRPYRRAMSCEKAAAILQDGRGRQWDPQIVDAFLRCLEDRLEGASTPWLRVVGGENSELSVVSSQLSVS